MIVGSLLPQRYGRPHRAPRTAKASAFGLGLPLMKETYRFPP